MVIAIGLGLGQITLLKKLFNEEEKHSWVAREKIFYLVQGHVLCMAWRFECTLDEIV